LPAESNADATWSGNEDGRPRRPAGAGC